MKKLESENSLVVRANQLIEAKYRLTATEQKIIHIVTAKINRDDEDFKPYTLKIADLMELIDTKNHNKYAQVKEVTRNLMKKVFTIHDIEQKREIQVTWFYAVDYQYGKGIVRFEFSPYLKPFMLHLKSNFTKLNLEDVMQLRSGYSLRMYELLKQYEKIGKRQFSLTEFRELLSIPHNEYPLYANLKKKVISQAHKEINAVTDILFDFEEVKEGKKVIALKFTIHSKKEAIIIEPAPQKQPSTETTPTTQTDIEAIKDEFRQRYKGELVDRFIKQMLEKKGLEHIQKCLRVYKDYIQGQVIKNIGGHFKTFVMNGFEKPVPYQNNNDAVSVPKHEVFKANPEEQEEIKTEYANMGQQKGKKAYEDIGKGNLKSMREILNGKKEEIPSSSLSSSKST